MVFYYLWAKNDINKYSGGSILGTTTVLKIYLPVIFLYSRTHEYTRMVSTDPTLLLSDMWWKYGNEVLFGNTPFTDALRWKHCRKPEPGNPWHPTILETGRCLLTPFLRQRPSVGDSCVRPAWHRWAVSAVWKRVRTSQWEPELLGGGSTWCLFTALASLSTSLNSFIEANIGPPHAAHSPSCMSTATSCSTIVKPLHIAYMTFDSAPKRCCCQLCFPIDSADWDVWVDTCGSSVKMLHFI